MNFDFSRLGPVAESIVSAARAIARKENLNIFLVGGPVRDLFLSRETTDIDLMASEEQIERFAPRLSDSLGGTIERFPKFLTMKVAISGAVVDLSSMRRETYASAGALPLVAPGSLDEDLFRRDFTVNSIALDVDSNEIVDPFGGMNDLEHRLLRMLHERSFLDDPTRILRGVRFSARLGFRFEAETEAAARNAISSGAFESISRERSWREIFLLLREPNLDVALELLRALGFLSTFFNVEGELDLKQLVRGAGASFLNPRERNLVAVATLLRGSKNPAATLFGSGTTKREVQQILDSCSGIFPSSEEQILQALLRSAVVTLAASSVTEEEFAKLASLAARLATARESLPRDLDISPGPHIGRAMRETLVSLALGKISPEEARAFAQRRAIEYLQGSPATPDG